MDKSDIISLRELWKKQSDNIPPYRGKFKGKGIVMCAGGIKYFTCCWIAIQALRNTGCQLPVELWYKEGELTEEVRERLRGLNVKCKDLTKDEPSTVDGYMLKPLAIIKSEFEEILFLDADNVCIRNPEYLFKSIEYLKHGAIFWPDFWKTTFDNPIWGITETDYTDSYEQESGQILVNKRKCWAALHITLHFNLLNSVYYKLLMGDKDTFRFAWHALKQPFYMVENEVSSCGYRNDTNDFLGIAMIQYGLKNEILFIHKNLLKWNVTQKGEFVCMWIKKFKKDANERIYYNGYSENEHNYIDLSGDVLETACNRQLHVIEEKCLNLLCELRNSSFYKRFLLYSNFIQNRTLKKPSL